VLNPSSTIIVGGWVRVRYIQFVTYSTWPYRFTAQHSRHIMCIDFSARNANLGRDNNARIRSLHIEIDHTNAHVQSKKPRRIRKKTVQKHAFTPNDFQMHQRSLDHSYCKRETSLTKLKNSKCVMILVPRLSSSPKTTDHINSAVT
jgi:hypothetical protein